MSKAPKIKRHRDKLSPKPILDRTLLLAALEERNIQLKDGQLDTFYQLLHRQHYPSLPEFVEAYYRNQDKEQDEEKSKKKKQQEENGEGEEKKEEMQYLPLKNKIAVNKNVRQLPKSFLSFLASPSSDFVTLTTQIQSAHTSIDATTTKLAVQLQDGHTIESVIMRHVSPEGSRATLCVSSQVGCAMGCTFCATGTMGIRGNLWSGEILEQLVHAGKILAKEATSTEVKLQVKSSNEGKVRDKTRKTTQKKNNKEQQLSLIRNIVFMGMGEPLNNYNNVLLACQAMLNRKFWNLSAKHVTVSTVGVIPKMRKLTQDLPQVSLALSLHAPNQPMRTEIVPTAKQYPIEELVQALDDHMMALTKQQILNSRNGSNSKPKKQKKKKKKDRFVDAIEEEENKNLLSIQEKRRASEAAKAKLFETIDSKIMVPFTNKKNREEEDKKEENMEFNEEQRKAASKRKRAMIEYVMCKCLCVYF
uniref:Radical SAM core domain-containing protein n=1 Tax=Ditylum brightwellii TaxID=49249 RepID=A0A7S4QVD8_9STRA